MQRAVFFHTSRTTGWDNFIRENFQFVLLGFLQIFPSRSQELMHVTFFLYPSALNLKYLCCSPPVRATFFGCRKDFCSSSYWCFPICYQKGIFGHSRQAIAINDTCRQQTILLDSEAVIKDSVELPWIYTGCDHFLNPGYD